MTDLERQVYIKTVEIMTDKKDVYAPKEWQVKSYVKMALGDVVKENPSFDKYTYIRNRGITTVTQAIIRDFDLNYDKRQHKVDIVRQAISNEELAIQTIKDIIPVIEKFDGKCYNVRFDKAIKEKSQFVSVSHDSNGKPNEIVLYLSDEYTSVPLRNENGDVVEYSHKLDRSISLMWRMKDYINDDKRIDAKGIVEKLESKIQHFKTDMERLDKGLKEVDEWYKEIHQAIDNYNSLVYKVPSLIKQVWNCDYTSIQKKGWD